MSRNQCKIDEIIIFSYKTTNLALNIASVYEYAEEGNQRKQKLDYLLL